jgi:hypothetical protein
MRGWPGVILRRRNVADVLDLSAIAPPLASVHDLRHTDGEGMGDPAHTRRSGGLLFLALFVPALVFSVVALAVTLVSLPFELIARSITHRSGLVMRPVQWLLSIITAPIAIPLRKQAKAGRSCPLCRQLGTVERVVDVTHNGNARVSLLGVESSARDPGVLNVAPHERLTISHCDACGQHFIEGPYSD